MTFAPLHCRERPQEGGAGRREGFETVLSIKHIFYSLSCVGGASSLSCVGGAFSLSRVGGASSLSCVGGASSLSCVGGASSLVQRASSLWCREPPVCRVLEELGTFEGSHLPGLGFGQALLAGVRGQCQRHTTATQQEAHLLAAGVLEGRKSWRA